MIRLTDNEKLVIRILKLHEKERFPLCDSWSKTLLPMMSIIYGWDADNENSNDYQEGIFMFLHKTLLKIAEPEMVDRIKGDLLKTSMFPTLLDIEKNPAKRGINYICGEIQHTRVILPNSVRRFDIRNYITHNDNDCINTDCISFQDRLDVSYGKLVDYFGEPITNYICGRDAMWEIQFDDGKVATIYNWKNGVNYNGCNGTPTKDITHWHIGGFNWDVTKKIYNIVL